MRIHLAISAMWPIRHATARRTKTHVNLNWEASENKAKSGQASFD
jgi:hypothetical protein